MRQGRRLWVLLVALVTATSMSAPAFAEVQNVKVGGDVTVRGIWRQNFDLRHDSNFTSGATDTTDAQKFIFSTVGVNLTADLTDNVSADIRLSNQRDFGANTSTNNDVQITRAYVTMKELLYSPLTVKIGRQPLWFGKGFIVGSRLLQGDTNAKASFSATEFTDQTGFDAIRATLDFNPATIDLVYSKVSEGNAAADNDITLGGINAGYRFSSLNAEVEAYYWNLYDQSVKSGDLVPGNINTIGGRGSFEPFANSSVWGEAAVQFGRQGGLTSSSQQALAFDVGGDYTFADVSWKPKLGAEWIFYSGGNETTLAGWNPIYRGKFDTLIHEFQGPGNLYPYDTTTASSAVTNQHQWALFGAVKPTDSVKVDTRLTWFSTDVGVRIGGTAGGKTPHFIGTEWDTRATYDYTEDVQFGLIYGVFFPGDIFRENSGTLVGGRAKAQELVSTVSVKF